jgi:hypothetical protein
MVIEREASASRFFYLSSLRMVPTPWPSVIVAPLAFT